MLLREKTEAHVLKDATTENNVFLQNIKETPIQDFELGFLILFSLLTQPFLELKTLI